MPINRRLKTPHARSSIGGWEVPNLCGPPYAAVGAAVFGVELLLCGLLARDARAPGTTGGSLVCANKIAGQANKRSVREEIRIRMVTSAWCPNYARTNR